MPGGIFGRKAGRAMKRLKIAVLFGGCSPEYSVSLQSAAAVLQNMDSSKYEAVLQIYQMRKAVILLSS